MCGDRRVALVQIISESAIRNDPSENLLKDEAFKADTHIRAKAEEEDTPLSVQSKLKKNRILGRKGTRSESLKWGGNIRHIQLMKL